VGEGEVSKAAASDLWRKACKHLKEILHPDVYSRWIAVIEAVDIKDDVFALAVDNDFYQTWLEDNYLPLIKNAIASVSNSDLQISFIVRQTERAASTPEPHKKRKTIRSRLTKRPLVGAALNPNFTFDGFIVGPSNSFAHAASLAVAQAPARAYNPLFIYGGVGLGKTHLMEAIGHHVVSTSSRVQVCYVSSEAFVNEYIDALQSRALVQFRKKYRNTDLLLIDDIHFLARKERLQEEFFHTFNTLFDARKQIVMTSDRPASEITGLEKRLVSRFEWGLVTELQPPDLETRIAILRNKQESGNVQLSDELILFIAENIRSNIRRLEGALIRSVSYASLTGQELTQDAVKHLLRDMLEQEEQAQVTFATIQRAVADHYDVRVSDMSSKCRQRAIAFPRQVAMYLCRRMTRSSLPDIANAFGKTHATVLHAYRSIDNRLDVDHALRTDVSQISKTLGTTIT
jgi:chromosomal replication initiator protein